MSKPRQKHHSRSLARRRQAARRYRFDSTEESGETTVFLALQNHELKGLEKLARRYDTSLGVEVHRAIDAHIRSDGQPYVRLLKDFLDRFSTSLNWHNKLLEEAIHKAMKIRTRRPRQLRSTAGKHRTAQ